ncbi:MAG TPA: ABC transporter permease subunit [Candidatus Fimisoma avicola]|uniref:Glutathione transport system permease protein GsiD n=1 Tax=Candidatus Fimisoma avicola TaxID=2840826 RepID=A0A9D1I3K4_9FIRM|nr:ABC transporter permease subunit [Candidatus Fimisoma avicola]
MDRSTRLDDFIRSFKKQKTAVAAAIVLILLALIAIFCYQIAPYGINEYDYSSVLQGPSGEHWFGTDEFGRDIFSRVICGTRISLSIGFFTVTIAAAIGSIVGLLAGYYGGLIESLSMRIADFLYAFPGLILAIAIVAVLGPGLTNVVIAVIIFCIPTYARLVRGATLELKNSVYVRAAKCIGASDLRILFKHILPGAIPSVIVQYSLSISGSIMTTASLSFLGMGAMSPTPEWGLMLSNSRTYFYTSWHYAFFPGIAIMLTVLCFNLLGDGLRTALDPKLNNKG